ncbi:MAG: Asp-tRNA(Asn)/Glu-tRNA(Gln) amidotransferase subunit GatB [Gemmatimonadota bacterium]|jgi:aspartyl-tRNA(Asn)/glutamyl-tRNA(Gln) amidotransferase subunit B
MSAYEPVIGLEVHVQLATRTKLFCGNAAEFGAPPNTHVCPVCLGLPGALPVLNGAAVELALRAALGLECHVHERSEFARKNYFYPDLPKGYQITQYEQPIATGGRLASADGAGATRVVHIRRLHIEEDAGKLLHDRVPDRTAVDLNRAGTPLVEIVTEPDVTSPLHARHFLQRLKQTLEYLEVSDCDMEKGSLRVDANVSLRPPGSAALGTKTELKNLNSFSQVERALEFEIARQAERLGGGLTVHPLTLLWDAAAGVARPLRGKEQEEDYRYFPEPDLPPLVLDERAVAAAAALLPELPAAKEARFRDAWGLPDYDASVLAADRRVADWFEAVATRSGNAKLASNWVMTDVMGWSNQAGRPVTEFPIGPDALAELLQKIEDGTISGTVARRVLGTMIETGKTATAIIDAEGLTQVQDRTAVLAWVDAVLDEHPAEAARIAAGEEKLTAFLMGRIMKRSAGKADPRLANRLLLERIRDRHGDGAAP